jgi:hypothetical protein
MCKILRFISLSNQHCMLYCFLTIPDREHRRRRYGVKVVLDFVTLSAAE